MAEITELLKKLQIKSGARLWFINVPLEIAAALTAGAEVQPARPGEPYDGAVAFCENPTEVAAFARQIVPGLPDDGLLWFAYRKGGASRTAGLTRDAGWASLGELGYRPVRSISFDDTWTGLRFRLVDKVKAKEGSRFARK